MLADSGYLSQANVEHCAAAKIEPLIALGRDRHHVGWQAALCGRSASPARLGHTDAEDGASAEDPAGRKLYALRKQTPEPVFGIIKSVMGFRQFLLRGLQNVKGEWNLVTMSWNIKRMFALSAT